MTACSLALRRCARARMRRAASTAHRLMLTFLAWEIVSPLLMFFLNCPAEFHFCNYSGVEDSVPSLVQPFAIRAVECDVVKGEGYG